MLFEPHVCFHILVLFGFLCGRLLGKSCSLGLRYVFFDKYLSVVLVFSQPSFYDMGISF